MEVYVVFPPDNGRQDCRIFHERECAERIHAAIPGSRMEVRIVEDVLFYMALTREIKE